MEEKPYLNREIDEYFKDVKDQLNRIENQTTKTNGRVSKLENWRSYVVGAVAVLTLIVLPAIGWILSKLLTIAH